MNISKKLNLIGQLLLVLATVAWGTSFFILKETIETVNELFVISIRFLISGVLLGVIFYKKFKKLSKTSMARGLILGIILSLAYVIQTYGLKLTTPSRNAFLTSSYCVMVPFIVWIMTRRAPKLYNVISAVLCLVGIGFVSFSSKLELGFEYLIGDMLTLVCAVFYGLQLIFIDKYQQSGEDNVTLLVIELLTVGIVCGALSLIVELPFRPQGFILNLEQILKIGYLTIVCTLFAQLFLIYGQKHTTVNQSSIILSLEAVFGALFSVVLGNEKLTAGLIIGFVIIFVAMIINELKLDPLKLFNNKKSIK